MVLLVCLEMRGELGDSSTEASNLILWAARIGLMSREFRESAKIDILQVLIRLTARDGER